MEAEWAGLMLDLPARAELPPLRLAGPGTRVGPLLERLVEVAAPPRDWLRAVQPELLVPRPAPAAREEEVPLEQLAGAELLGAEAERLAREEARLMQEEAHLRERLAELQKMRGAVKQRAARLLELVGA